MRPRFVPWPLMVATSLVAPAVAFAADPDEPEPHYAIHHDPMPAREGLQLGARFGYAFPLGTLGGGAGGLASHLSDLETASVPIGLDAGYRVARGVYLGGTFAWAPGIDPNTRSTCKSAGVSCSRQDWQLRAETRFYFSPEARRGVWVAFGIGWEVATFSQSVEGRSVTSTLTGPVIPDLQLGVDFRGGALAIGPYFGVTFAEFVTDGVNPAAAPVNSWIDARALHEWVTFGLRGSYGPW